MVDTNWKPSLALVRKSEGGNDDDPADHGGRTSRGITQREYSAWLREQGRANVDVWSAPDGDIDAIYHDEYWDPWCDLLPLGVDYLYFDMAVNAGPHRATVLMQQALGVTADGRIGPITREAIRTADPRLLITRYTLQKEAFYRNLHQPRFLRGWLNRTAEVRDNALHMIGA